jgi:NADPH:quinone reductase-like Zn-dependent oxidoreductase
MQVTSETTVAAPIETVWDKLSNHAGMSGWAPGITVRAPAVADGRVRPVVDRVFIFDDAHKAADYLRSNQAIGKVVLEMKEHS